ncbi:glyoxylate reductase [Halalkalibacter wakoensis JCM 9140]|uniref:Glyoxylate reductase n=1 Tax=Halalkalibacter wakoensis JCM 9140 TaxID=1236970 RepID=W4Q206_9BACI|nr:D-glycerate dehydrogenase [Halalkalibacter wakoensis]GAE25965.1 glyoxylate reductase [Halalkalibacter wakoensis JCM 9140]
MKPKVLVTSELPGDAISRLEAIADVKVHIGEHDLTKSQLIEQIQDKDAVISLLVNEIDKSVLQSAPNLKVVANYAVGFNNIDVDAATERNVVVTNTPDVLTEATADLAWALLLGIARRVPESDQFVRDGKFEGWKPNLLLGRSVHGKTLGVIGMGRIGEAVAKRAKGFDMEVLYYNRRQLSVKKENELNARYVGFEELLRSSDFISLHAPLTDESYHIIGKEELTMMKSSAYIINTSRGPLIDEGALVKALVDNVIAGAGLDVFEREPVLEPVLDQLPNVVLAPHVGSATIETRVEMANLAVDNVINVLKGLKAITPVNPEIVKK